MKDRKLIPAAILLASLAVGGAGYATTRGEAGPRTVAAASSESFMQLTPNANGESLTRTVLYEQHPLSEIGHRIENHQVLRLSRRTDEPNSRNFILSYTNAPDHDTHSIAPMRHMVDASAEIEDVTDPNNKGPKSLPRTVRLQEVITNVLVNGAMVKVRSYEGLVMSLSSGKKIVRISAIDPQTRERIEDVFEGLEIHHVT